MFLTNRQNDWMKKLWGVSRRPDVASETPGRVLAEIRPIFEGLGWLTMDSLELEVVIGAATVQNVPFPPIAEGVTRLYWRGTMEHNDPAGTKNLWVEYDLNNVRAPIGGVASNLPLNPFVPGTIQGLPFLATSGNHLRLVSGNSLAAATNMQAELFFIDLPPGAYIPGIAL